jgi:hypothetical protein
MNVMIQRLENGFVVSRMIIDPDNGGRFYRHMVAAFEDLADAVRFAENMIAADAVNACTVEPRRERHSWQSA